MFYFIIVALEFIVTIMLVSFLIRYYNHKGI